MPRSGASPAGARHVTTSLHAALCTRTRDPPRSRRLQQSGDARVDAAKVAAKVVKVAKVVKAAKVVKVAEELQEVQPRRGLAS